ncbi:xanthine dehydrogenase accessory protein XdhC [Jiella pacifica]|uniref:Xanthine dehydrogenase accessory protein XdhC n=1 Tax=Jiella pacifica TaxID=2696469 RepID=A0A6N9SZR1_9HYPH|nr:xanthine dehydrogenase accessory protein XdhC [Jiella pacifica]NDW03832.1 xanthine dehydrogenase accessory protein XdhC [Jiella pacifica]
MTTLHDTARAASKHAEPAILVTVETALGSTPREAGASMLVKANAVSGTIGGGRLEFDAIDKARRMIEAGEAVGASDVPLGPEIGQCCGGRVHLSFRRVDAVLLEKLAREAERERETLPAVMIFGAGHTGRALAAALAPLPLAVSLIDSRPETLAGLPEAVRCVAAAMPEAVVEEAPAGAAYVVMTHDHALDFLVAAAALARSDAAYVGMIGSATKRERFRRHLAEEGREAEAARLTLPIGGSELRDKRPEVIAALTAAEVATCLLKHQE